MYLKHSTITGDFSKGVTPVLIPNTEVKTFSAEHTCLETSREPRSLPVFPKWLPSGSLFLSLQWPREHFMLTSAFTQTPGSTRQKHATVALIYKIYLCGMVAILTTFEWVSLPVFPKWTSGSLLFVIILSYP